MLNPSNALRECKKWRYKADMDFICLLNNINDDEIKKVNGKNEARKHWRCVHCTRVYLISVFCHSFIRIVVFLIFAAAVLNWANEINIKEYKKQSTRNK